MKSRLRGGALIKTLAASALSLATTAATLAPARAEPAISVLGADFVFPNKIQGFPSRLSEFSELQIHHFTTNDGVKLAYWEAGHGEPLIFVPGWSGNGAEYVNVMFLLAKNHRVIVLDPRNQGLSQKVAYGTRIARLAMDLKQLVDHLGVERADLCGWSMGAAVIWSYIDLFGTKSIRKLCFVDEPIAIVGHPDWSAQERSEAGAMASAPDQVLAALNQPPPAAPRADDTSLLARFMLRDSPWFANSEAFAQQVIRNDPKAMALVLWDHANNDWRDVVRAKIDRPTAIFTGEFSANAPSQRWAHSVIPKAELHVYGKSEQGDHFLMFKNPVKFARDLEVFLGGN
ncbi:Pimeloyl-ACP methyl ester carboxylesterase [Rhodoblastus acidophilus]|uniref:Pimeloyl-ACP methyl ester carboxylesterase n=1 Tax=Rhodoblastus acidophilus TaxID=1074 RepID=A0A212S9R9_RHOAC|nr:alpha/beta hydrolase [Rhodoblastus acidophilus]PPQ36062.1 alpha/beta hydrolase [Rhodoblastus acidophilus]RAI18791.1 alpha/beta hydrolase [Rhodoblastus acidophilus]SNB82160.1 Pimeloyl-ACP methyl ester carboxylesterase [Rhodoblastus acidophilus]